jgi:hypothetical protein
VFPVKDEACSGYGDMVWSDQIRGFNVDGSNSICSCRDDDLKSLILPSGSPNLNACLSCWTIHLTNSLHP